MTGLSYDDYDDTSLLIPFNNDILPMISCLRKLLTSLLLATISTLWIASCSQLPDYARPRFYDGEEVSTGVSAGFNYRRLSIEDFQAAELPSEDQRYHGFINARSCINIRPANATKAYISKTSYYGSDLYVGTFTHIEYEALFIPSCSWWNPKIPAKRIDYVLQHEQIHFAIGELTARKVTQAVNEEIKNFTAIGSSQADVTEELMKTLRDAAHKIIESELAVHTSFDKETSMFVDRNAQQRWFTRISKELNENRDDT